MRLSLLFYDIATTLTVKNTIVIPIDCEIEPLVIKNCILEITDKLEMTYNVNLYEFDSRIKKFQLQFNTDKGFIRSKIIDLNNPVHIR